MALEGHSANQGKRPSDRPEATAAQEHESQGRGHPDENADGAPMGSPATREGEESRGLKESERVLKERYTGLWGHKVAWLAALTLIPPLISLKIQWIGLEVSPAQLVYIAYHGLGVAVLLGVRSLRKGPFRETEQRRASVKRLTRMHSVISALGWAVIALLLATAACLMRTPSDTGTTPLWCAPRFIRVTLGTKAHDECRVTCAEPEERRATLVSALSRGNDCRTIAEPRAKDLWGLYDLANAELVKDLADARRPLPGARMVRWVSASAGVGKSHYFTSSAKLESTPGDLGTRVYLFQDGTRVRLEFPGEWFKGGRREPDLQVLSGHPDRSVLRNVNSLPGGAAEAREILRTLSKEWAKGVGEVVLIDGIDEVSEPAASAVIEEVDTLAKNAATDETMAIFVVGRAEAFGLSYIDRRRTSLKEAGVDFKTWQLRAPVYRGTGDLGLRYQNLVSHASDVKLPPFQDVASVLRDDDVLCQSFSNLDVSRVIIEKASGWIGQGRRQRYNHLLDQAFRRAHSRHERPKPEDAAAYRGAFVGLLVDQGLDARDGSFFVKHEAVVSYENGIVMVAKLIERSGLVERMPMSEPYYRVSEPAYGEALMRSAGDRLQCDFVGD